MGEIFIQIVFSLIFLQVPVWKIYSRVGLNPWISLMVLVPFIGILLCGLVLAISNWKLPNNEGAS